MSEPSSSTTSVGKAEALKGEEAQGGYGTWKRAPFFVKPGPRFGHRLGQSLKRWWPLHLFIIAAVTLIIVLPLVYVGFPNIAQGDIDGTDTTVDGVMLSDPTQHTIRVGINSTLHPHTSFKPDLSPFNAALTLTGSTLGPFSTVRFPGVHVQTPLTVNITDQLVNLDRTMGAWEEYVRVAIANDTYSITVEGKPDLTLGALPKTTVNFNKTVAVPGLNGFKGISTSNITVNISSETNNFKALTMIPNQSTSNLNIGNITFNTYVAPNQTFIGQSFLNNVHLTPGNNTFPIVASVQQQPTIAALGVRPACETGMVEVTLEPTNVTYNGLPLHYLLQGMSNITQVLPLGDAISAATGGFAHYYCPPGV